MPMRAFFLVLASLLSLCAPCAGWAASAAQATQDPRSTIQQSAGAEENSREGAPVVGSQLPVTDKRQATPHGSAPIPALVVTDKTGKSAVVLQEAPEQPLEFQSFVHSAIGAPLTLFGREFFSRAPNSYSPVEDAPIAADYVIGPGDEVLIRAWGQVDIDYRAKVDRAGNINIPKIGVLHVAGTDYRQLNPYIRTAISRVFRNFELNVSLGELRSIQIFIVGHARYPGTYMVSSMSTLLSALFSTGGPSSKGSVRRIILRRNNATVTELDLYDFLLRGDKSRDVRLLPGDVIQIVPVGPLAAIVGSINNPAVFELKKGETLAHLLESAGGLTTTAAGQRVTVERIIERSLRKVEEFNLDPDGLMKPVRDGDIVRVYPISPKLENVVSLRGNVAMPANMAWRKGMRISDLIPDRSALLSPSYWVNRNLAIRRRVDSESEFNPRVNGELNWNYAVIERIHPVTQAVSMVPFNLAKAVLQRDPSANLLLEPGDVVTVFSREDIRQPVEQHDQFVRIEGEVRSPGLYRLLPGETVRQLLKRLGGITPYAYLFGAELSRASARNFQQKQMEELVQRMDVQLEFESIVQSRNAGSAQEYSDTKDGVFRSRFLSALRQLKASGRVLMDIQPAARQVEDLPDLLLEDGDRLYIPPSSKVVTVVGAVQRESSISYRDSMSLQDYLNMAGGMAAEADDSGVYVLRANGSVWSRRSSGWLSSSVRLMPGDTVVVPYDSNRTLWRKFVRDWAQIFYQFGIGIAAINALNK